MLQNLRRLFDYSQPFVAAATVLSVGAIIAVGIGAQTLYRIRIAGDLVSVTGSAKQSVAADSARWTIHLETRTGISDQSAGFARLEKATAKITAYLESAGFAEYETPALNTYPTYSYPDRSEPIMTGYSVARDIIVRSGDIDKTNALANNISPLSGEGYSVSTGSLELTYSKLAELRVSLLSEAIADARERAEAIAKDSGRSIGALRTASSGVVQVLPQGGVDISDYGYYDTQSRNKDVMVTVRASFQL